MITRYSFFFGGLPVFFVCVLCLFSSDVFCLGHGDRKQSHLLRSHS